MRCRKTDLGKDNKGDERQQHKNQIEEKISFHLSRMKTELGSNMLLLRLFYDLKALKRINDHKMAPIRLNCCHIHERQWSRLA